MERDDNDLEIKHYKSAHKGARHKQLFTERVTPGSETDVFLKRMEVTRLGKESHQTIDMRGKVVGECKKLAHKDKVHFLDEVSWEIFKEGVKNNQGMLTVGTYEAIVNGAHTLKALRAQEEAQQRTLLINTPAPAPLTPAEQADPAPRENYHERYNPEPVFFGYYKRRKEPRLLYVTDAVCTVEGVDHIGKTRDISTAAMQVVMKTQRCPMQVGQTVTLTLPALQENAPPAIRWGELRYQVTRIDQKSNECLIVMERETPHTPAGFSEFLTEFIALYRHRHRLDAGDESTTSSALIYGRLYGSATTQIPFYVVADGEHELFLQKIARTAYNQEFFDYFRQPEGHYDFSPITLPSRLRHLYASTPPFTESTEITLPSSIIVIIYRDQLGRLCSRADYELEDPTQWKQVYVHALEHADCRLLKIFLTRAQTHNPEKLSGFLQDLAAKAPAEAQALAEEATRVVATGLITDITSHLGPWLKLHCDPHFDARKISYWIGAQRVTGQDLSVKILEEIAPPAPAREVLLGHSPRRREDRYLARTKIEITVGQRRHNALTRDISTRGLAVLLETPLPLAPNDSVTINFLSFSNGKYRSQIEEVPYRVIRTHYGAQNILTLKRERNDDWAEITEFFQEIISINKQKLKICLDDLSTAASARIYEDWFVSHLSTLAFFMTRGADGGVLLQKMGVTELPNPAAHFFYQGDSKYDFRPFSVARQNAFLYDQIKKVIKKRHGEQHPTRWEAEIYFYKERGTPPIFRCATDFEMPMAEKRRDFMLAAITSGVYRFFKLIVMEKADLKNLDIDSELDQMRAVSRHRAHILQQDLENLIAYGELIDITRELTAAVTLPQDLPST